MKTESLLTEIVKNTTEPSLNTFLVTTTSEFMALTEVKIVEIKEEEALVERWMEESFRDVFHDIEFFLKLRIDATPAGRESEKRVNVENRLICLLDRVEVGLPEYLPLLKKKYSCGSSFEKTVAAFTLSSILRIKRDESGPINWAFASLSDNDDQTLKSLAKGMGYGLRRDIREKALALSLTTKSRATRDVLTEILDIIDMKEEDSKRGKTNRGCQSTTSQ